MPFVIFHFKYFLFISLFTIQTQNMKFLGFCRIHDPNSRLSYRKNIPVSSSPHSDSQNEPRSLNKQIFGFNKYLIQNLNFALDQNSRNQPHLSLNFENLIEQSFLFLINRIISTLLNITRKLAKLGGNIFFHVEQIFEKALKIFINKSLRQTKQFNFYKVLKLVLQNVLAISVIIPQFDFNDFPIDAIQTSSFANLSFSHLKNHSKYFWILVPKVKIFKLGD
ncbi:hypothetical protein BpHYR1_052127 [Brachionus plicatilis]|uniref:Transmembrane protein n=1 Tax=Brachionus plicatilis TaxID=10195 RepID=A0A3M7RXG5_BRAPC|nr:hypothetical protein BpHYR1_052127 [Brachionus plicatilis]